jgi:peptidoglycan hydrolase-like protein with peptidoglycan-binding domain
MRKVLAGLIRRRSAEIQYFCMIRRGMSGKEVENIQKMLNKVMLYYYEIDSIFGEETEKSVIEFQ